jgi:hypothetical protein
MNICSLKAGLCGAFAHDTESNEVTTNFYACHQLVFEVSSFFSRTRSKENIQALEDCEGWFIRYEQLNQLFHAVPEFREFGRAVLVKGFASLKTRLLSMITETAYSWIRSYNSSLSLHYLLPFII